MYQSSNSAAVVADCIAKRWEKAGADSFTVPISITQIEQGYFVGFEMHVMVQPIPFGLKHPAYSVWAEVMTTPSGSATEYHRAMQFTHERIDRAVQECQEQGEGTR